MAKVLFFLQLILALVLLPLWPGSDPRYLSWGLVFLGGILALPVAAVTAVFGPRVALRSLTEVWSPVRLGPASQPTVRAWSLAAETFPAAGTLGGLVALIGPLQNLDPTRPLAPQWFTLALFCLVWGFLGLLLGRIFHQVAVGLSLPSTRPLLVLTAEFGKRFGLTRREVDVAQAVLDGLTYKDAAEALFISPATAKSHVLSVYQKTGAGNKIELLRLVEAENERIHQTVDGGPAGSRPS